MDSGNFQTTIKILGPPAGKIVVGPNVYRLSAKELIYDLGFLEQTAEEVMP